MPRIVRIEKPKSTPVDGRCGLGGKLRSNRQLRDARSRGAWCIFTGTCRSHRRARRAQRLVKARIGKVAHILDSTIAPDHDVLRRDAKMEGGGKAAVVH